MQKLSYYIFFIILLFQILFSVYGEQHYVFRGNQQDAFVYLSTGLLFFKNTYSDILNLQFDANQFYAHHVSGIIHYRPSVGLLLATLNNISFVDIFILGFVFKIICTSLVLLSCLSLFGIFEKRENYNLILAYSQCSWNCKGSYLISTRVSWCCVFTRCCWKSNNTRCSYYNYTWSTCTRSS